jgi:hypothetical protein
MNLRNEVSGKRMDGGNPVVLIIDQFEELLSLFTDKNEVSVLGDELFSVS